MTLLDATPPKPPRKIGRYILLALAVIFVGLASYVVFRNSPEERTVSRFLTTLEQGITSKPTSFGSPAAPTLTRISCTIGASGATMGKFVPLGFWDHGPKVRRP